MKRAIFIDRDGTLNVERNYLSRPEDLELIPGAGESLALARAAGWTIVVITNQSGIGRGYFDESTLDFIHGHLLGLLAAESSGVDAIYHCPHIPSDSCTCRKPEPGMLQQAATDLGIDLSASWMIGDNVSDIGAGIAAGCRTILVRTGHGERSLANGTNADAVVNDLPSAIAFILALVGTVTRS